MSNRRLKWHHLGLIPGLLVFVQGIYVMIEGIPAMLRAPSFGFFGWLDFFLSSLLINVLPGAFLIAIYLASLRVANDRRASTIASVFTLVLLGAGAWGIARWYLWHGNASALLIGGCLLPGLLMLIGMLTSRSRYVRTAWAIILPLVFLASSVVAFGYLLEDTTGPCNNVALYANLLREEGSLASHFPRYIPAEARHVHLYYQPVVLQGGSHFEIRYGVSAATARADLARLSPGALAVYNGSPDPCYYVNECKGYMTGEFQGSPLPKDFRVVVLDAEPYHPNDWNHGHSVGVAISLKSNEEIYWADDW